MKYKILSSKCDICGCCSAVCAENAVKIEEYKAYIIDDKCIGCKKCFIVCPVSAIIKRKDED